LAELVARSRERCGQAYCVVKLIYVRLPLLSSIRAIDLARLFEFH
jgi:hypothetical protein